LYALPIPSAISAFIQIQARFRRPFQQLPPTSPKCRASHLIQHKRGRPIHEAGIAAKADSILDAGFHPGAKMRKDGAGSLQSSR
jgi:hypothetical protein